MAGALEMVAYLLIALLVFVAVTVGCLPSTFFEVDSRDGR